MLEKHASSGETPNLKQAFAEDKDEHAKAAAHGAASEHWQCVSQAWRMTLWLSPRCHGVGEMRKLYLAVSCDLLCGGL